jgi:hypothetical protein
MVEIDAKVIQFQCPRCGFELEQTIGQIKAEPRLVCKGCEVDITIDASRLVDATETRHGAVLGMNAIAIKFFQ